MSPFRLLLPAALTILLAPVGLRADDDESTPAEEGEGGEGEEGPQRTGGSGLDRTEEDDVGSWTNEGTVEKKEEKKEEKKKKELAPEPSRSGTSGNWYEVTVECGSCANLLKQEFGIDDPLVMREFYDFVQINSDKKSGTFVYPSAGHKKVLGVVDKGSRLLVWQYVADTGSRLTDIYAVLWDLEVKASGGLLYGRKYEIQAWTDDAYEAVDKGYRAKQAFLPSSKLATYPDLAPVKGLSADKANFSIAETARIAFVGYAAFVRSDVSKDAIQAERDALTAAAEAEAKRLRDQQAWYGKAEVFIEQRSWTEAQSALLEARKLGMESSDLSYNLGLAYQMNKDYDGAIKEYQAVLALNPRDTDVRYNVARIYEKQKAWDKAITEYQVILKFDPEDGSARERLELLKAAREMVQ